MTTVMVSTEEFIRIWQSSHDIAEVVRRTGGKKKNHLQSRASKLRKLGVDLKKFEKKLSPGRPKMNLERMNRIAAESLK